MAVSPRKWTEIDDLAMIRTGIGRLNARVAVPRDGILRILPQPRAPDSAAHGRPCAHEAMATLR